MGDRSTRSAAKAWFAPKSHGYGSGLPIAWQGWALLGSYLAVMLVPLFWLPGTGTELPVRLTVYLAIATLATVAVTIIARRTTRGGWRWRWGEDD